MLDVSYIPTNRDNVKIFYATSGSNSWQTWVKPRGARFVAITCVGAGGGGGTGLIGAGIGDGGGSGGGGGSTTQGIFLASMLPDVLYVQPGVGGKGGAATKIFTGQGVNAAGQDGEPSLVAVAPTSSAVGIVLRANGGNNGSGGSNSGVDVGGGPGGVAMTTLSASFASLAIFTSHVGGNGGAGSSGNVGALTSSITCGGAGGRGRVVGDGRNIIPASIILTTPVSGGLAVEGFRNGRDGYGSFNPLCGTGGSGGASRSGTGTAGRGGNGWYGCGGGGGGAVVGSINQTGTSIGGDGGNGLVVIATMF